MTIKKILSVFVVCSYLSAIVVSFQSCGEEGFRSLGSEQFSYLASNINSDAQSKLVTLEDITISGQARVYADPDNRLKYSVATQPTLGKINSFDEITANFEYVPDENNNGLDSFEVVAIIDNSILSERHRIDIEITPVNDAPNATTTAVTATEDTVKMGKILGSDVDSSALTFSIAKTSLKGSVVVSPDGSYVYSPQANANGADSFSYNVTDGELTSAEGTVNLTIATVNDLPVATNGNVNTDEDVAVNGVLSAADIDGDSILYSLVAPPQKGIVVITNINTGAFRYTPNVNANGADTFTFRARDGVNFSNTAAITVNLNNVNDAPVAQNVTVAVNEDTSTNIQLLATDSDGDAITYRLVTQPTRGFISNFNVSVGTLTYRPNANSNGADSFQFAARDASLTSLPRIITINVTPVNDPPVSLPVTAQSTQAGVDITPNATDIDSVILNFSVVTQPTNGKVAVVNNRFRYTPNAAFMGADIFTYKANDGVLDSNTSQVNVSVLAPPVITLGLTNITLNSGENLFLKAQVTGFDLKILWQKDGVIIPNQETSYYQKAGTFLSDAGVYKMTASNIAGSVSTSATVVIVDVAPRLYYKYVGVIGGNQIFDLYLIRDTAKAILYTWNYPYTGSCTLFPPTDAKTGFGTIAAGTKADVLIRRLSFGLFGFGGPCNVAFPTTTTTYL
ncbi:MAG: Ig-like domain-containing protein [Pseudomonadota bacterium]|nr:Ig-like domain-containing protein [Pseudomonadota bacterium]